MSVTYDLDVWMSRPSLSSFFPMHVRVLVVVDAFTIWRNVEGNNPICDPLTSHNIMISYEGVKRVLNEIRWTMLYVTHLGVALFTLFLPFFSRFWQRRRSMTRSFQPTYLAYRFTQRSWTMKRQDDRRITWLLMSMWLCVCVYVCVYVCVCVCVCMWV